MREAAFVVTHGGHGTVTRALAHLLENAVRLSPPQNEVRVALARRDGRVRIAVTDNGPGIPLPERDLVFQPFYRALGTNVDGSGLGLPIVKEIAQQHGATISIDATFEHQTPPGACFTLRFKG